MTPENPTHRPAELRPETLDELLGLGPRAASWQPDALLMALQELQARRRGEWICLGCFQRQDAPREDPPF